MSVLDRLGLPRLLWPALVAVAVLAPFALGGTQVLRLQQVIYLAVAILSLNLLTGWCGQISFGQCAYIGASAYATALLVQTSGWSYWAALPVAIVMGFVIGALTGLPALRISGIRLALASVSIAFVFPTIPVRFTEQTGGNAGFVVDALTPPPWLGISITAFNYWVLLTLAMLVFVLARNVMASRIGRAMIGVRDQQVAAQTVGVDVVTMKVAAFGFSGALCGLAGWMFVVAHTFVSPSDFMAVLSINLLVGMAVGGSATLVGPVFGALFLVFTPRVIADAGVNPLLTPLLFGVALILILLYLPRGVGGLLQDLARRPSKAPPHLQPEGESR
ncbi:branched-chain amino acid ABC transporter permease [Jiangella alba]|uniref:Branched-chain amino acid transport system permease protein n=1 Tax=Jiangella alba TaxID=561176 RepID=A0A1H5K2C9_9ACTN|nr:branched-chain amino acid ABC transporter permease [Jiangella alba]SEE58271.1 branched-chain amino acid transport system permease protein [Jiangella alba]